MATAQRPFQLVVFGASGFTGQFVTEEVAREQVDAEGSRRLPWAVAGRCREKLQGVLERAALKLGKGGRAAGRRRSPRRPLCWRGAQGARNERFPPRAPQASLEGARTRARLQTVSCLGAP